VIVAMEINKEWEGKEDQRKDEYTK